MAASTFAMNASMLFETSTMTSAETGSNGTRRSPVHRLHFEKMVSMEVLVAVAGLSFVANGLVLFAIWTSKHFRKPMNFMIGNLVVASVLQIAGVFGFYMVKSQPPDILKAWSWACHLIPGFLRFPIPAEVFTVLCVALDRIRVVQNPLDVETALRAKKKIALVWISALALEMPLGIFWTWREAVTTEPKEFQCYNTRLLGNSSLPWIIYTLTYLAIVYVTPTLILLKGLLKLMRLLKILRAPCSTYLKTIDHHDLLSINAGRKREAIRNAFLFIVIFILTKLPTGLWHALYDIPVTIMPGQVRHFLTLTRPVFAILFVSHCALYPAVVFALSREIRKYYKDLLRCRKPAPLTCSAETCAVAVRKYGQNNNSQQVRFV